MDERIAERRRGVERDRRRRRGRLAVIGLVIVAVATAGALVERSPLVALAEVQVVGADRLEPRDVRAAADLPLGTSTLRLRLRAARERVEALPLVRSATVQRVDPLTVRVTVRERVPELVVTTSRGAVLVDGTGLVIDRGGVAGLARVATTAAHPPAPGSAITALPAAANAVAVHAALPGPLRAEVVRYEPRADDDVDLILRSGLRVRFGRADHVAEKARTLGALLPDLEPALVALVDVRAPSNPVVLPQA